MDDNYINKIKVATIDNKIDDKFYQLSSVYIAIGKEFETEGIEEDKYVSFLSYELINIKEILFFLDPLKFKEIFKIGLHEIEKEFKFPFEIVLTIHIHDMKIVNDKGNFHTYYVTNLKSDKLIKNPNGTDYSLNITKKNGDNNFKFTKSNDEIFSYQLYYDKTNNIDNENNLKK